MDLTDKIDLSEDRLRACSRELLDILLLDRTTGSSIVWATEDYRDRGEDFAPERHMVAELMTGAYGGIIAPRASRAHDRNRSRQRDKAEVCTPAWICNVQNNLGDAQWFGRENVFNIPGDRSWTARRAAIEFPDAHRHSWQDYVDLKRLEMACGEAPYLVSRYDASTGQAIPLAERIGLLDRKLRVVGENAKDEETWFFWAFRALESIYGFELQGDNLLLARENVLADFLDYAKAALGRLPTLQQMKRAATVISWNLWQMDAFTFAPPFCQMPEPEPQLELFPEEDKPSCPVPEDLRCRVKDWRSKVILDFYTVAHPAT